MLRRMLTNNAVMATLSIALLFCGVALGAIYQNFIWVNRFGALVICAGIIITARPIILRQATRAEILDEKGISYLDDRHYQTVGEPIPEWLVQERMSRVATGWLGPAFVFIGTLATGFGDLLNKVAGFCAT